MSVFFSCTWWLEQVKYTYSIFLEVPDTCVDFSWKFIFRCRQRVETNLPPMEYVASAVVLSKVIY